jgi:very-short-patch-repair endonuclease
MGDPRMIDEFASRQYGVISSRQARKAGLDKSAVRRRVASGAWVQLDHSVYAVASSPPKWERRLAAAILSRPKAVLTHTTAAHLLEMRGFRRQRPAILVPRGSNTRSRLARVYETDEFDRIGLTHREGFTITTVPETLLVLGRDLPRARVERVFDDSLIGGRLDLDVMTEILNREAGRRTRGIRIVRELTTTRLPSAPSKDSTYLEGMLEGVLHSSNLPAWTREYPLRLPHANARVDVYVPSWALVIEADGRNWHMKKTDFESDRRRDNALAAQGIQVLRYTYQALRSDPAACIAEIQAVGSLRAARGVA